MRDWCKHVENRVEPKDVDVVKRSTNILMFDKDNKKIDCRYRRYKVILDFYKLRDWLHGK